MMLNLLVYKIGLPKFASDTTFSRVQKIGSPQEFVGTRILGRFLDNSFDDARAHVCPAVVQDSIEVTQKHDGELRKRLEPLPPELVDPAAQVVQHRAFIAIVPEPIQAFLEDVGFEQFPVEREKLIEVLAFPDGKVEPARQQQPAFPFTNPRIRWPLRKNSARRTSSIAWLACCMIWNLS